MVNHAPPTAFSHTYRDTILYPDFFILGVAKAGTTSLYHYLRQHPQLFLPTHKEPRFFAYPENPEQWQGPRVHQLISTIPTSLEAYLQFFAESPPASKRGDASPTYFSCPWTPARIARLIPHAQFILILRNPIERAYSHFLDNLTSGWEPLHSFEEIIQVYLEGKRRNWWFKWHYIEMGFYAQHLSRYFQYFKPEQFLIIPYETYKAHRAHTLQTIFRFLQVNEHVPVNFDLTFNTSGVPRNQLIDTLLNRPNPLRTYLRKLLPASLRQQLRRKISERNKIRPPMSSRAREQLRGIYREDVHKLSEMLNQDFTHWVQ